MKKIYFVLSLLLSCFGSISQTTVFSDNFNTSTGATYTIAAGAVGTSTTWSLSRSGVDWGARIDNGILDMTNDGSGAANVAGWGFASTPTTAFIAPYNAQLNLNSGIVTWTFNIRTNRANLAGFTAGSYGMAFILAGSSTTANNAGNGYALVLGNTGGTDPFRLVKYTGGLISLGVTAPPSANDIIVSNTTGFTNIGTNYYSVKVTYTPGTNTWELFLRDDGTTAFADPEVGTLTTQGTAVDATHTGTSLGFMGGYWQGSTAGNQTCFFDNVKVTVPAAGTPTINVTPASLTGFVSTSGVPSVEQSYSVDGSNLTADITITPPAGFEISTTNAPFTPTNPITLTQTGGNVPATTIYARLNSTTLGVNTGNITNTSTGANNPNVSVTGKVLDAEPTTQGSITIGTVTNSTIQVTLTAGNGAKQLLAIHALTPVANDPVDGTTYTANTAYGAGSNLGANTYVVFNGVSGNGGAPITITGLTVATTYHFAVYEFNDGGGISGAENYLVTTPGTANATTLNIVNTYVWTGANNTLWTDPLNWLPVRTTPSSNDSLLFVGPLTVTVTGVPTETIGYLGVSLGANVTLQASANNNTLTISGGFSGEELELEAGSQLNISGNNALTINIPSGNSSIIDGDMTFSAGVATAHKLTAGAANGITFNTGSSFTAGAFMSGNPFGAATANSVVFLSGSVFNQIAGSNPFALGQPASVVVFQTGSLYRVLANLTPSLSGRTYADLEVDFATFSVPNATGGNALSIDNLTMTQGLMNLNLTGGISIKGNITVAPGATLGFNSATANTVTFNGAAAQSITNNGTFTWGANESLTINNAAGVTLNSDITIGATATLALTNGILKLNAPASMLTLSAGTTLTGGNSNASYVDGKVRKIGNTDFTFPIGKTGFGYVPIRVSNFAGGAATDQFDAEYLRGNARLLGTVTDPLIDHVSGCDWWTLDRTNGTPTVDVTAYWSANNVCNGTYVDNLATLALVHFDGTNWNSSSVGFNPPPNGTIAAGDITWPAVTTFSPFALGSTSTDNPLPITINYFTGVKQNGDHQLNWKVTCTNTPTVTMALERSSDGRTYTPVNSITATALQCQQPFGYTDAAPAKGVNYYRLKLTDVNGKTTYSSIVSLINASSGIDVLNIAPNPIVGGRFTLKVSAAKAMNMELVITDMQGRAMQKQALNAAAGFNTIPVDVRSLAAGTYQLYGFTAEGKTRVLRFVVQ